MPSKVLLSTALKNLESQLDYSKYGPGHKDSSETHALFQKLIKHTEFMESPPAEGHPFCEEGVEFITPADYRSACDEAVYWKGCTAEWAKRYRDLKDENLKHSEWGRFPAPSVSQERLDAFIYRSAEYERFMVALGTPQEVRSWASQAKEFGSFRVYDNAVDRVVEESVVDYVVVEGFKEARQRGGGEH